MQKAIILFALTLFFTPFLSASAQSSNAGIIEGLWYSKENVYAGETVRVYVAIRNNTDSDLKGIVEFYDGEKKLERQNVQALSGRIIESWSDWTPTYGSHNLRATLTRTELHEAGGAVEEITVVSALSEDTIFVDYDTDKDGIGNEKDTDDDGDGKSDSEEKATGTNPLVKEVVETPAKQKEEKEDSEDSSENETSSETTKDEDRQEGSEGLEQYLAPSRAETVLSSVTDYVDTAKQKVDAYREKRAEEKEAELKKESASVTVNEKGFGEITRTQEGETPQESVGKKGAGFLDKTLSVIGSLLGNIYTLLLFIVSFVLGHPILVQLGLLLAILFIIIRLAAKFGNRRNRG